jgi:hypothetical protein
MTDALGETPYFGGCPACGKTDGYVNVGCDHWFVCDEHSTKWYAGSNLFSCWEEEEDEAVWQKNTDLLGRFVEVKPLRLPAAADSARA